MDHVTYEFRILIYYRQVKVNSNLPPLGDGD